MEFVKWISPFPNIGNMRSKKLKSTPGVAGQGQKSNVHSCKTDKARVGPDQSIANLMMIERLLTLAGFQ